jgi:hypothetical protein
MFFAPPPLPIRKFVTAPGGRRTGDQVAYVTRIRLLRDLGAGGEWVEDLSFNEKAALRDNPNLKILFDKARQDGVAHCIRG